MKPEKPRVQFPDIVSPKGKGSKGSPPASSKIPTPGFSKGKESRRDSQDSTDSSSPGRGQPGIPEESEKIPKSKPGAIRRLQDIPNADEDSRTISSRSSLSSKGEEEILLKKFAEDTDSEDEEGGENEMVDIKTLKKERRIMKKLHNFSSSIASNSSQAIIVIEAKEKKIVWVNLRAQIIFGRLAYTMLGQCVTVLIPPDIAKHHDRKVDNFIEQWQKERAPPESKVVNPRTPREIRALKYDFNGTPTEFMADLFISYIPRSKGIDKPSKYFVAYVNDMTVLNHLRHQIRVTNVIQEKSAEAIVVADLRGSIISMNSMGEQMFGVSLSFLLKHKKNISWFMPKKVAAKHDGYLSNFRSNLVASYYDITKSTMMGKSREFLGRRPGNHGDQLFSVVIRVEMVDQELVAYIRDTSDTITRTEFNNALGEKLFPKIIRDAVKSEQIDVGEVVQEMKSKTILFTDLENYTQFASGKEVNEVFRVTNAMYVHFDKIIQEFSGELVKRTGDGVIVAFGLSGNTTKHAEWATFCGMAMLKWCNDNGYRIRIGLASGDIGSGVFGDPKSRQQWDIWGETVNIAARMESNGIVGRLQLHHSTKMLLGKRILRVIGFEEKIFPNIKGVGKDVLCFLSLVEEPKALEEELTRVVATIDRERQGMEEKEKQLRELQNGIKNEDSKDEE